MKIYDSHTHTNHSHDGKYTVNQMAQQAQNLGLDGIIFTDHVDSAALKSAAALNNIYELICDIDSAKENFNIEILKGMELGDMLNNPFEKDIYNLYDKLDFVLASTHVSFSYNMIFDDYKGHMKYIENHTDAELDIFLKKYYDNLKKIISTIKADSIAHITFPFKYISVKCGNHIDMKKYYKEICEIMKIGIERDMALEINTSACKRALYDFIPNKELLVEYKKMGGKKITLGSDAHITEHIARSFDDAFDLMRDIGFNSYFIYKNHKPTELGFN